MPHLVEVTIDEICETGGGIVIEARSERDRASCPDRATESTRAHGRYRRRLTDTAAPLPRPGTVTALGVDCAVVALAGVVWAVAPQLTVWFVGLFTQINGGSLAASVAFTGRAVLRG